MNRQLLLGAALGAGLAAIAFVASQYLVGPSGNRTLMLATVPGGEDQAVLIAAAGECVGRFKAEIGSHSFMIQYPVRELTKEQMVCLIEELGPSKHDIWIQKAN